MLLNSDTSQKQQKLISIFIVYIAITCAVYILPSMIYRVPYVIAGCLMLISMPVILFRCPRYFNYVFLLVMATAFLFLTNAIVNRLSIVDATNDAIRNLRFFIPVLWGCFALRYCDSRRQKVILILFFAIVAFVTVNTMIALEEEPWISRLLAADSSTSSYEVNVYRLRNVGGYSYSYMLGVVTILFSWLAVKLKKLLPKILCIVVTVLCFYYIIQTMYTTLLLLCSMGLIMVLFFNTKSYLWRGMMLIFAIALWVSLSSIFGALSEAFGSESFLSTRFSQMQSALEGGGVEVLGSRPVLLSRAVQSWIEHPIFGSYNTNPSHSLVFEYLQQNGLFGLGIWISIFVVSWRLLLSTMKKMYIDATLFNIVMCYFLVLSVFNDTRYTFEITIATYFIVPVFSSVFCKMNANETGGRL